MNYPEFSYILTNTNKLVKDKIIPNVPKKYKGLMMTGINCFSIRRYRSINSNSRSYSGRNTSRATAEMRVYRLLRNSMLTKIFYDLIPKLVCVCPSDCVSVDYSTFKKLGILTFALRTNSGRAIPLQIRALPSNVNGYRKRNIADQQDLMNKYSSWKDRFNANQYTFVINSLKIFYLTYRVKPILVLDRGFVNITILKYLIANDWPFVMRMREDWKTAVGGKKLNIYTFRPGTHDIAWNGINLRLVVTMATRKAHRRWYIITNLDQPNKIIKKTYYHRFEIEETFKDIKHSYGLERHQIKNWQSLAIIMKFIMLGVIMSWMSKTIQIYIKHRKHKHQKKLISFINIWLEQIEMCSKKLIA